MKMRIVPSLVSVLALVLGSMALSPSPLAAQDAGVASSDAPSVAPGAAAAFASGERLFREDKPADAAAALETAVALPGVDERAWLYLAACYEELGKYDVAVSTLRKGTPNAQRYKHLFYYNMGNAFVLQGKNAFAEDMYGQAIAANANFAQAYLNRANVRITLKELDGASADYSAYLALDPASSQRPAIEDILKRLGAAAAAQAQAQAAAEAQREAEEAAKKALLDQVQASLKASAEETTSLSTGSGQVQGYGDNLELDQ